MGRGPTGPQGGGEAPEQWVVETLGPLHPPQMWEDFRPDAGGSWGLCPGSQAPSPSAASLSSINPGGGLPPHPETHPAPNRVLRQENKGHHCPHLYVAQDPVPSSLPEPWTPQGQRLSILCPLGVGVCAVGGLGVGVFGAPPAPADTAPGSPWTTALSKAPQPSPGPWTVDCGPPLLADRQLWGLCSS